MPNVASFAASIAELTHGEKSRTQSVTDPAYLMRRQPKHLRFGANLKSYKSRTKQEVVSGCRGERCHDDSIAMLALTVSIEAVRHDAVRRIRVELAQHGMMGTGAGHHLTPEVVVVVVIATIEHNKSIHSHPLLRNILHTNDQETPTVRI